MKLAELPVDAVVPSLLARLRESPSAVLVAAPGAGKTTRVPPAIAMDEDLPRGQVIVLQPRRAAARAVAARIAQERGWKPGREVGHHVRFDNQTTRETRLAIVTEGILARRLLDDPFLEGVACVVLDEFHERSIHCDVALALLREVQSTVRPDLRLLVMSATLDAAPVAAFLGGAPIIEAPGRLFPVEIGYRARPPQEPLQEAVARAIRDAATGPGHVLVFLPGIAEIRRTEALLRPRAGEEVHVLHSSVPADAQDRALRPSSARKIILSTNIAETSITIDGVATVIDSGLARVPVMHAGRGLERLETRRISIASATQRAGRAGRTGPGRCIRLWAERDNVLMPAQDEPDIRRLDLAPTVLALHAWGCADARTFAWLEKPPEPSLARSEELLRLLGATDDAGKLTARGRRLAAMPLHPRLGAVVLAGTEAGLPREAALLAALLSEADIARASPRGLAAATDSDVLDLLDDVRVGRGVAPAVLERVRAAARQVELPRDANPQRPQGDARAALRRALLRGWPDRVARRRENDDARVLLVGGRGARLAPECGVRRGPLMVCLEVRDDEGEALVHAASAIEEAWLAEDFSHLREERLSHEFVADRGRVSSRREVRHLDLCIKDSPASPADDPPGAARALGRHVAANPELVLSDDETRAWLARVDFLRRARPELALPDARARLEDVVASCCEGAHTLEAVLRRNPAAALRNVLTWQQARQLDELAPARLEAPSGASHPVDYTSDPPVYAVRLQEVFGWRETPRVAGVPLRMQLLAPNFRPAQVTQDLASFWANTYAEVRKELKARYPKHPWPEDPLTAQAVAVGRRRR